MMDYAGECQELRVGKIVVRWMRERGWGSMRRARENHVAWAPIWGERLSV